MTQPSEIKTDSGPKGEPGEGTNSPGGCGRRKSPSSEGTGAEAGGKAPHYVIVKSFRLSVINWFQIATLYVPYALAAGCVCAVACLLPRNSVDVFSSLLPSISQAVSSILSQWYAYGTLALAVYWWLSVKPPVYLVDFEVYRPPEEWKVSQGQIVNILEKIGAFTPESLTFMERMLERSGTGQETHWPAPTVRLIKPELGPKDAEGNPIPFDGPDTSIQAAREVAEQVMFSSMEGLIARTGLRPKDIDFLVVNCSLFCPTPSLCSSVSKRFGLRPDVRTYNLGGMGCSAGLISIDLAKQLLQNKANSIAVVISFEDITQQLYVGNQRSMLLQNTLFRVGGAAVMLSNKPMDGFRAKYKLLHTVRIQDTTETAHRCVYQCQDPTGNRGIELSKDLMTVAAKTLRDNLTVLGPHVLPVREQAKVLLSMARRKLATAANAWADKAGIKSLPFAPSETGRYPKYNVYIPDFKKGIHHFCIHAGGRAVIDGIEENLKLMPYQVAPSRATLKYFGNTSSSSIWYELKYVEAEEEKFRLSPEEGGGHPVGRGERVVQIAFGSGFKCNSAVWLRMK